MNSLVFCLLVSLSASAVSADGYTCQSDKYQFSPPDDLSQPLFWPSTWNDSQPPARFETQQFCQWEFTVPEGLYATAVFYRDAPSDVRIFALWPSSQNAQIENSDQVPFIFTSPKFNVDMFKSEKQGAFSFKVTWSKYPTMNVSTVKLAKGDKPAPTVPTADLKVFTAETNVSLVAFTVKDTSKTAFLRHSAIFDGNSTSGTFLGTLSTVLSSKKAVVSTGNSLSVYTFGLDKQFDYTLYMAQDHSNDQGVFTYQGINCPTDAKCSVEVSAVFGPGVFVTVGAHPEFVKGFDRFPENGTLKVYEGMISDQNLVTTLTKSNYIHRLPMELKNSMRHYVLSNERFEAQLGLDSNEAKWNKASDGRKGFVHSMFHGENSSQQDTDETFTTYSNAKLYFNFIVRDSDFPTEQTALTVTVSSDGKVVSSTTYNSKNLPPANTVSSQGDTFNVKYESHGAITKGFRVDFSVTSAGYATSPSPSSAPTAPSTSQKTSTSTSSRPTSQTSGSFETTTRGASTHFATLATMSSLLYVLS